VTWSFITRRPTSRHIYYNEYIKEDEMNRACGMHGSEERRGEESRREEKISAYKITGKPDRKKVLGRPRLRLDDNIKMDLREIGWGGMD
jgi:hypothetical protein